MIRKIVHIDQDAFYASVEQRDNPDLRGRPVAVGGSRERGVVAAASYEARKFGVRSAMPSITARRACPDLIFVKPRFEVYRAISAEIREVFAEYTHLIEPLSLDEAYLDVTENIPGIPSATRVAEEIRAKIKDRTGLTASAGVSYNKFLAKMASSRNKPDGQFVITPEMGPDFVLTLPVAKFHGIGEKTAERMKALGIVTGADLREKDILFLTKHFGKAGAHYHAIARGIDERPVRPDRIRKSVGAENTFAKDLFDYEPMKAEILSLVEKVWEALGRRQVKGKTVTLKVKFSDFTQITRARSASRFIGARDQIAHYAIALLDNEFPFPLGVRLLGVTMSSLDTEIEENPDQMSLGI